MLFLLYQLGGQLLPRETFGWKISAGDFEVLGVAEIPFKLIEDCHQRLLQSCSCEINTPDHR